MTEQQRDPKPVGEWDQQERREAPDGGPDNARADDLTQRNDETAVPPGTDEKVASDPEDRASKG